MSDLEEAAQEYSFNIPTQFEANTIWKKETEQHFKDGALWKEQHMKEALQTEYEKGRFDMREEIMKDAVDGKYWIGEIHLDTPIIQGYDDGDRIKFIPIKDKQQ